MDQDRSLFDNSSAWRYLLYLYGKLIDITRFDITTIIGVIMTAPDDTRRLLDESMNQKNISNLANADKNLILRVILRTIYAAAKDTMNRSLADDFLQARKAVHNITGVPIDSL